MRNQLAEKPFSLLTYLVKDGLLDRVVADHLTHVCHETGNTIPQQLIQSSLFTSEQLFAYCQKTFSLPSYDLTMYDFALLRQSLLPLELIRRYRVLPLARNELNLQLGITDPTDKTVLDTLSFQTGLHIQPVLVAEQQLDAIISQYSRDHLLHAQLEKTITKMALAQKDISEAQDEPIMEFVQYLLQTALTIYVSDIHLEPHEEKYRIRFRRDGLLFEAASIPQELALRITSCLKIMANLNIAERRLPQDGRFQLQNQLDVRVNACPTLFGEKLVLRLLDTHQITLDIHALGLTHTQTQLLITALKQPQGLILVTGPTGSGKTVTLYSALHYLNQIEKNILTVEDPIEIELQGINQVSVNPKIGLSFASVLRTFLRQDPDIIMIGEIRDLETATIAMQAAHTGHLVLSTLHTNSAIETITRLQAMGLANYQLISSLSLIIAQRLVRKLCVHCKQPEIMPTDTATQITYRAVGCAHCHHGYAGRIGVFECLPITEPIRQLILSNANPIQLQQYTQNEEWLELWDAGLEKIHHGITSYAELLRVIGR